MKSHDAIEVAKTALEVADVAWKAVEVSHHYHHNHHKEDNDDNSNSHERGLSIDKELESLRSENGRLRDLLEQNLKLLENLSESPCLSNNCPPDLYAKLMATVDSENFTARLKSLQEETDNGMAVEFPFKEATEEDVRSAEYLVNVDHDEPSWWVWVTEDMVPGKVEEKGEIDNENYIIVSEEHVVDGVANFMAKCIVSSSKAQKMTPEELQKTLAKALADVSKLEKILNIWHVGELLYVLSTWGLALAGLYHGRAVLRLAAMGAHTTSKLVLKAV